MGQTPAPLKPYPYAHRTFRPPTAALTSTDEEVLSEHATQPKQLQYSPLWTVPWVYDHVPENK